MFTLLPRALTLAELERVRMLILHTDTFKLGKYTWNTIKPHNISYADNTLLCAVYSHNNRALTNSLPSTYTATHVLSDTLELYALEPTNTKPWNIKHPLLDTRTTYMLPSSMQLIDTIVYIE